MALAEQVSGGAMTSQAREPSATEWLTIGAVVDALQPAHPDVSHSSLRFLEREGLVTPARTPGGHRLYAPEDLNRLRQIKSWQARRLTLDEIRQRLAASDMLASPTAVSQQFLSLAIAGEMVAAAEVVLRADDLGLPLEVLFREVLTPALIIIGELWAKGEIIIGQEKTVSHLVRDLIAALSLRHAAVAPHGAFLVAAGVEGEDHDLGLQMICSLLRARGRRLHCLGANVALPVLIEAIRHYRPGAILLTATQPSRLSAIAVVREAIAAISESAATIPIVVGGQIVAEHAATLRAGGILVADLDHVDAIIDRSFATYRDETAST